MTFGRSDAIDQIHVEGASGLHEILGAVRRRGDQQEQALRRHGRTLSHRRLGPLGYTWRATRQLWPPRPRRTVHADRHHDRGTGRPHLGALAPARPRRRGPRIRLAVPIGSRHQRRRPVAASLARDLDLAHRPRHADPAHPVRAARVAGHLLPPGDPRQDGRRARHAVRSGASTSASARDGTSTSTPCSASRCRR